jgi:p-hydroxybenzoate 3-monooxygenase
MKTGVAIIGAGPAGLLLGHLLRAAKIDCVVVERESRAHVESRIRAGVLERTTTDLLRRLGIDERLDAEAMLKKGSALPMMTGRSGSISPSSLVTASPCKDKPRLLAT